MQLFQLKMDNLFVTTMSLNHINQVNVKCLLEAGCYWLHRHTLSSGLRSVQTTDYQCCQDFLQNVLSLLWWSWNLFAWRDKLAVILSFSAFEWDCKHLKLSLTPATSKCTIHTSLLQSVVSHLWSRKSSAYPWLASFWSWKILVIYVKLNNSVWCWL